MFVNVCVCVCVCVFVCVSLGLRVESVQAGEREDKPSESGGLRSLAERGQRSDCYECFLAEGHRKTVC